MGKLTDQYESRWGKRRPWIAAGTALCALCVLVMWHASLAEQPYVPRRSLERKGFSSQHGPVRVSLGEAAAVNEKIKSNLGKNSVTNLRNADCVLKDFSC